jgi:hypothetical protein
MMPETCCSGKKGTKVIRVAGQDIGISGLDSIIEEVIDAPAMSEDSVRRMLLQKLKAINYVPKAAEDDYVEALLLELKRRRNPDEA